MSDRGQGGGAATRRIAVGETIIAAGVLLIAAVVFWQTLLIPVSPIYAKVGPTVVPTMTAIGLGIVGLLLLYEALTGGWQPAEEKETTPDRAALLWITCGLVLNVTLIGGMELPVSIPEVVTFTIRIPAAGFTFASTLLFVCVARGFGSKALLRDAAIGLAFSLVAYFGFAKTLGINIGSGWIEGLLDPPFDAAVEFVRVRLFGGEGG